MPYCIQQFPRPVHFVTLAWVMPNAKARKEPVRGGVNRSLLVGISPDGTVIRGAAAVSVYWFLAHVHVSIVLVFEI